MTKDLADELERLAKEATPGEWRAESNGGRGSWIGNTKAAMDWAALSCGNTDDEAEANAALIVALRNALPEIISALRSPTGEGEPVACPAGYKLVPVEPTEAMLDSVLGTHTCVSRHAGRIIYGAMLRAAPALSASGGGNNND